MKSDKKARLERAGWVVGDAAHFLKLSAQEQRFVELKLALAAGGPCVICTQGRSTALAISGGLISCSRSTASQISSSLSGPVDVNADARQSLDLVLVECEETVCGHGSGWLAPQPRGLLREFDKGEKPSSFYAHEASPVIGRSFHTIAFLSVALFARQVRLTLAHHQRRGPSAIEFAPSGACAVRQRPFSH